MITGSSPRERIQRQSASPSIPGSITSSTTRCGDPVSISFRAVVAVGGLERLEPVALEVADDDVADDRLVVDDEDGGHRRHCHSDGGYCSSTHLLWCSRAQVVRTDPVVIPRSDSRVAG